MHCYLIAGEKNQNTLRSYLQKNGFYANESGEYVSKVLIGGRLYSTVVDVQDDDESEYQVFVDVFEGTQDLSGAFKMEWIRDFAQLPGMVRKRAEALCNKMQLLSGVITPTEPPESVQIPLFLIR